jgi:transcriptional regulator with PAS, ATPase and Fis domain
MNVLLHGESGTGKEIVAQALQLNSLRHQGPFVGQNCAALPETLFESELFGHKAGAFTGASSDKKGLLVSADGGTFFLDEIGDMPMTQANDRWQDRTGSHTIGTS